MITKQQKKEKVEKLKGILTKSKMIVFSDYRGLTVSEITRLRRRLQSANGDYVVAKNTLAQKACEQIEGIVDMEPYLKGPTALTIAYGDPAVIAKGLLDFMKESKKTSIKGVILENKDINIETLKDIANLPSREVMISRLLGTLNAPATNLAYALKGVATKLVGTLEAVKKQKEESAA